jgi:hypothetical protein
VGLVTLTETEGDGGHGPLGEMMGEVGHVILRDLMGDMDMSNQEKQGERWDTVF